MKRFCLSLVLGVITSTNAFANLPWCEPITCHTLPVTVPTFCGGFEFDIAWLYLRPTTSNLDYVVLTKPFPINTPNWETKTIKPGYASAFDLGIGYVFPCSGNDIRIDWLHLFSSDGDAQRVSAPTNFVAPFESVGPAAGLFKRAHGHVNHHFDNINLTYGQFVDIGCRLRTRLFGGLTFGYVRQVLKTRYTDAADTIRLRPHQRSEFTGGGPQIGVESSFQIWRGLSLIGDFSASVLVGNQRRNTKFTSTSPIAVANIQHIRADSKTQVVPALDGRIGFSYCFCYCNTVISLEVGYRAGVYFNAIQSVHPGSLVVTPATGTVAVATMDETISNFNYGGPYLAASIDF